MARKKIEKNIAYDTERKLYYVTLNLGKNADGKYEKKYQTVKSKREARQILAAHKREKEKGLVAPLSKDSFVSLIEQMIDLKALQLQETTIYAYRRMLKNHFIPFFKNDPVESINLQKLQQYKLLKSKTLSANTINKHFALLHMALQDAMRKQKIFQNVADYIEPMKIEKKKIQYINTEEAAALCESVKDTQLELAVTLAIYLGLRRGEVLGLRWGDIDFDKGTVKIANTRTKAGGSVIEKDPKTEKSKRTLQMCSAVISVLKKALEQKREREMGPYFHVKSDYVVVNAIGKPFSPNYLSDQFHEHVKSRGMKQIRFHDLRHAFASIAYSAGVPVPAISAAMGHSNMGTTLSIYTHEFDEIHERSTKAVAEALENASIPVNAC